MGSRSPEDPEAAAAAQFDSLLEGAPLGIGVFDLDLRHVRVNTVLAEMNGRPVAELVGRTPSEVNGETGARAEELYRRVIAEGVPMRDVRLSGEVSARPGRPRHWSLSFHPVHRPGSDTEVTGLCVIVDDVTAEEELARSLEETRARVEQITESMAAGYLVLDTSDERWPITYTNTQAEVALGLTRRELLGASLWELFPATVGTAFEAGYRRALDGGGPFVFDAYYPPPLDAWYEVRAVPEGTSLALYFLDVSDRVEAQRAAETAAERAQLLARVSEELSAHRDPDHALRLVPGLLVPTVADWCVVTVLEESERADSAVGALARAVRGGDLQAADAEAVDLVLEHLDDLAARHADPVRDELVQTYSRHRLQAYRGHARAAADGHEPVAPPFLVRALVSGAAQVVESGTTGSVQATMLPGPAAEALERLRPRTAVAVAVRARGRVLGVLSLCWDGSCSTAPASVHPRTAASPVDELGADPRVTGTARRPAGPGADVLTFVQTVADRVGAAIDEARLVRAQVQIAETLQRALLTEPPQPDHAHVVTRYLPAAEAAQVGGDWYDAFLQEDGASVLVIGDVLGHDRTSTAAMGQVRTLVRAAAVMAGHGTGRGPAEVLTATDAALRTLRVGTIATSVVARLEQDEDLTRRGLTRLRWSTAGHPPPVLVSRSGVPRLLDGPGQRDLLLGVDPDLRRHESTVDVERGSTLLLYTDGLVERRGESLQVGLDRLLEAVGAAVAREPRDEDGYPLDVDATCDAVLRDLLPEHPGDDVALVAIRLHRQDRPRPASAGPRRLPPDVPGEPDVLPAAGTAT
ncbi:SpoIIE family protein phosphatase [Kineococcus endophyticus]|uniref:SpoIIE family protein phosphatase n=1 Tax=Kineococcus endophyticus TaxID=1181883 RepID=A0ABV3P933_9ACTN